MNERRKLRSTIPMRTAKIGYITLSALLCTLGVVLIVFPEFSISLLETLCGIVFIAFGIVKIIGFLSKDLYRLAFQFDLEFGILMIVVGLFTLIYPGNVINFFCAIFGIFVLADALFKIRITLDARKFGIPQWGVILVAAIAAGIFGGILVFRPGEGSLLLMICLGITLLAEGILSMATAITMVKIVKHQSLD